MSFMAAAAPLDATPSALKTASFPAQRAANDDDGEGCAWQYLISPSVKLRETKVSFHDGTAEISSAHNISVMDTSRRQLNTPWSTPTPATISLDMTSDIAGTFPISKAGLVANSEVNS